MKFQVVSLSVTKDHIARVHVAGCQDVAKDSKGHGDIVETIVADNAAQAVEKYLASDLAEMGYSASDVLIVNCAKGAKEKTVAKKQTVFQTPAQQKRSFKAQQADAKAPSKAQRVRDALAAGATLKEVAADGDLGVTYAYAWDILAAMIRKGNIDPKAARAAR